MNQNKVFRTIIVGTVLMTLIMAVIATPAPAIPPVIQVTNPTDGQALNTASPAIAGTADPGVDVMVYIDGALAGEVVSDSQGIWAVDINPLSEGTHSLYAQAADTSGNVGTTATITFEVDLTAAPVTITYPLDGAIVNRPVIEGLAEPGADVTVYVYDIEAEVSADALGFWSYEDSVLPQGDITAYALSTDKAGNTSTSETISFTLDTTRPKVLTDIFPGECATQVPLDTVIRVYMVDNSLLDVLTMENAITLWQKRNSVNTWIYDQVDGHVYGSGESFYGIEQEPCLEVTFQPNAMLQPATTYVVSVSSDITDAAGNPIYPRQWFFTTVGGETTLNPHGNYIENVNVCVNCHTPHRARSPEIVEPYGQSLALVDDYCNACHDGTSAPLPDNWDKEKRHDYRISRDGTSGPSACTACHAPHLKWTVENPNLLQDFYYYDHNDPTNPYLPDSSEQALCELCHEGTIVDDPRVAYEQYRYKRWHTSTGSAGNYSLCLGCHDGRIATDIKTAYTSNSRHIIQAQDGSKLNGPIPCSDCHDTHGSDNQKLINEVLGHDRVRGFQPQTIVWDPATERMFCTGCHNNSTELYGLVAGFLYDTPGHESESGQACSSCHGGTPLAAAHAPQ